MHTVQRDGDKTRASWHAESRVGASRALATLKFSQFQNFTADASLYGKRYSLNYILTYDLTKDY